MEKTYSEMKKTLEKMNDMLFSVKCNAPKEIKQDEIQEVENVIFQINELVWELNQAKDCLAKSIQYAEYN